MSTNRAALLMEKAAYPLKVDEAPMPQPRSHEMIIRVHAVAINPVDMAVQAYGMIYERYPRVLGHDAAGVVTAIGDQVTAFKVGDRVIGWACVREGEDSEEEREGTFQTYCVLLDSIVAKLPDHVPFIDGAVLPAGMGTACVGLFEDYNLGLPYPEVDAEDAGKAVLIWGGASSVGSCGIQAAKAAGLTVAATASPHNHEYCTSIGADHVFDYKSESVVQDVVGALREKTFAGAFAAVMGEEVYIKCAEIASQLGGKQMVATVLPPIPAMKYDEPLPGGVEIGYNWGDSLRLTSVGPAVWGWVEKALANGSLQCKPDAYVVGQGLEKIQEALDLMKKGASARKYVVELP